MDAADAGRGHDDRLRALGFEKTPDRELIAKIELRVSAQEQILVALSFKGPHHRRTYQTAVPGDINLGALVGAHGYS